MMTGASEEPECDASVRSNLQLGSDLDESESLNPNQPLVGVLIADLTSTLPGPYCTSLLERLGARVIKFEPPWGDVSHNFPALFQAVNGGKESVVVDLKKPDDRELVRAVVERSDAVVEGWRPSVAQRLHLGPEDLLATNPALVYCSISGYGSEDDRQLRPGHDLNYVAASGFGRLLFPDGEMRPLGVPMADLAGGVFAALRVATAVLAARISGRGGFLDVSLSAGLRDWAEAVGASSGDYTANAVLQLPHYGVFSTADGHQLTLGTAYEDDFWVGLCRALDVEELGTLTVEERIERFGEIRGVLAARVAAKQRHELEVELGGVDTCWAFVDQAFEVAPPGGMLPQSSGKAPTLGEHSDAVRHEFMSPEAGSPTPVAQHINRLDDK